MKWVRAIRRNFGITAPRLAVRTHVAWYWRWLSIVLFFSASIAIVWVVYDAGRKFAGFDRGDAAQQVSKLTEQVAQLQREISSSRTALAVSERQRRIDQAMREDLAKQVRAMQTENARLKEDLSFFHSLMAGGSKEIGVSIYRFKVEHGTGAGEYRYRLLLLQSGQREREFKGNMQLLVSLVDRGKPLVVSVPPVGSLPAQRIEVGFKYYQRIEGTFQLGLSAQVKSVQVQIFERGSPRPVLTRVATVS
jgi:hypothetical protein